jgi:hypothetical protein
MAQQPGVLTLTSLAGTETVLVDNGGPVFTKAPVSLIAGTAGSGAVTTSITGTETLNVAAGSTPETVTVKTLQSIIGSGSFTTASMSNSTSITLSVVFTALSYTQTSTGNTVHLKAAPVNGETQGFSMTNIVTNLTVSSAANTVLDGAVGTTVAGQSMWWIFNSANTSWYKFNGQ